MLYIILANNAHSCPGDGDCKPSKESINTKSSAENNKITSYNETMRNANIEDDNNSSFSMQIKPKKENQLNYINKKSMLENGKKKKISNLEKLNQEILFNYHSNRSVEINSQLEDVRKFMKNNKNLSNYQKNQISEKIIGLNNTIINNYTKKKNIFDFFKKEEKFVNKGKYDLNSEYLFINDIIKTLEVLDQNGDNTIIKNKNFFKNSSNDLNKIISDYKSQLIVDKSKLIKEDKYKLQNNLLKNRIEQLEYAKKLSELMR